MLLAILAFYAAWRGMRWMYDWQQAKFDANWFVVTFNCIMACLATVACVGILCSTNINISTVNGFKLDVDFGYVLKAKE